MLSINLLADDTTDIELVRNIEERIVIGNNYAKSMMQWRNGNGLKINRFKSSPRYLFHLHLFANEKNTYLISGVFNRYFYNVEVS